MKWKGRGSAPGLALLSLFIVLMLASRSYRHWVEFGPQQHVITPNPEMGVHTRLTDEVEPWKIQRTLEMVRQMGAPWIVEYFLWAAHERPAACSIGATRIWSWTMPSTRG